MKRETSAFRCCRIRARLKLSQEKLARLLGVSVVSVNRWEHATNRGPQGAVNDLYVAIDEALIRGVWPEAFRHGLTEPRGLFLYWLFAMAYGPGPKGKDCGVWGGPRHRGHCLA